MLHRFVTLVIVCAMLSGAAIAAFAQESPYRAGPGLFPKFDGKQAEPGVTYGPVSALPLPRTILYAVSPQGLLSDAEAWTKMGFGAFFVTGVASEWSTDIWAVDKEPWTMGSADTTWQIMRKANERCRQLGAETFLTMAFTHTLDWFDDLAWQKIENNFRQFALFAKSSGCTGIAIDIEYIGHQYSFSWSDYDYIGYTRRDLVEKVRSRGTQIGRAIFDAFPDAKFLTFPEQGYNLGSWLHAAWIEEAARRSAPGGVHFCVEYTYRRPNIRYMLAHAWLNNRVIQSVLSDRGKGYWKRKCSIAEGLWPWGVDPDPNGIHGAAPSPAEFRQTYAASLMAGSQYNWVYSHDAAETMLGRDNKTYPGQAPVADYLPVIRERQIATNPTYVRVAQDLRRLKPRDYGADLGLSLVPGLIGPREDLEVEIMPASVYNPSPNASTQNALWNVGLRVAQGEQVDMPALFPAQTQWMLVGPFDNTDNRGFETVYPPEQGIDLRAAINGLNGKVGWTEYNCKPGSVMVDLARAFSPSEHVCAYALCYVHSDTAREVQFRVSGNDVWKLWVGGKLVRACSDLGRIYLDREVIPVSLSAGVTPVLIKVCNDRRDWGFVLRITDRDGKPVRGVRTSRRAE